jgi:competence protein ComEC
MFNNLLRYSTHALLGGLGVLTVSLWGAMLALPDPNTLKVHSLDVGQGDSILVRAPSGNDILIDGGPDATVLERVGTILGFFDRSIDLVVLTHPDKDHLAGLVDVLDRALDGTVLTTGVKRETAIARLWERKLGERNIPVVIAKRGLWSEISPGMGLLVFSPDQDVSGQTMEKTNNAGIVTKLVYGENDFIFTADIERPIEELLARTTLNLDADVLKVAHHGSKTSSSENFLAAVSPDMAVISSGKNNSYGHPHQEVIERLKKHVQRILRTDLNGTITFGSDGVRLWTD